jgi:acyl-CoA synthetase (AMP-forming)/AMP-acid ligase II
MYLTQMLHRNVQQFPHGIAIIDGDRQWTWTEFRDRVARFAGALQGIGMRPGDRVAMLARNGDRFVEYIFGTPWAGGAINPVNIRWSAAEMGYSLENCGTRILIVDREFAPMVPAIRDHAAGLDTVIAIDAAIEGALDYKALVAAADPVPDAMRCNDDLAAVLYTGGTTGFPKGVMLSHRNLCSSAIGMIGTPAGRSGSRYLHCAPLFHVGALSGLFLSMLSGSTHVMVPGFDPAGAIAIIARRQVTDFFLVPTMLRMMLDHPSFGTVDMNHVLNIRYGASTIDDALLDRAMEAFPQARFSQAYGMTELSPICSALSPGDHSAEARRAGKGRSAGRATPVTELRVVDVDDNEVPRGTVGEICARGPTVMMGYWGMPEATAEALRGGWMHTGDMGWMDDEGYVTVVDRMKDVIITGGENVYSAEVERALSTHPAIGQVAVIAVPCPRFGEQVHAVVVLRAGAAADQEGMQAHVRERIAGYKVPRSFSFVDTLPLSAAGKVLKNVLREEQRKLMAGKT